jgi:hypothetical protein
MDRFRRALRPGVEIVDIVAHAVVVPPEAWTNAAAEARNRTQRKTSQLGRIQAGAREGGVEFTNEDCDEAIYMTGLDCDFQVAVTAQTFQSHAAEFTLIE